MTAHDLECEFLGSLDAQPLFAFHRKGQQYIPRHSIPRITRRNVQHSAGNYGAHAVNGAASSFYAIDSLEILNRVEVPDDLSGIRFVSANVAIPGSEKDNTGNDSHRRRLSCAATGDCNTG